MDLATVVLTAAVAFIFILQMITMNQVSKLKKAGKEVKNEEPGLSNPKVPQKEREIIRDKRRVDRPQVQETQVKPQTPITSVESSLRDINLRLKNAERDQERARRKMGSPDDAPRNDRPRNDRLRNDRPRDDRPRDDRPRDDRPRNDRPRNDRPRNDRPRNDRPRDDRPQGNRPNDRRPMNDGPKQPFRRRDYNENVMPKPQEPLAAVPAENRPMDAVPPLVLTPPVLTPPVLTPPVFKEEIPVEVKQPEAVAPVVENAGSQELDFGRGSKITLKRRTLNGEGAELEKVAEEQNVSAPAVPAETQDEQNVSFGRR